MYGIGKGLPGITAINQQVRHRGQAFLIFTERHQCTCSVGDICGGHGNRMGEPLLIHGTMAFDAGYLFTLYRIGRFFVIRAKSNTKYRRRHSHPGDESGGVRRDRTIALSGVKFVRDYPLPLRRIHYHDVQTSKTFNFLTNDFAIPAQTATDLYRYRWQVELFFKWIKQHLRIKSFFGTSENAVKSQIWIAIPVYTLVAIIKNRLDSKSDLYTILQRV